jgi:hypothetical protein
MEVELIHTIENSELAQAYQRGLEQLDKETRERVIKSCNIQSDKLRELIDK